MFYQYIFALDVSCQDFWICEEDLQAVVIIFSVDLDYFPKVQSIGDVVFLHNVKYIKHSEVTRCDSTDSIMVSVQICVWYGYSAFLIQSRYLFDILEIL